MKIISNWFADAVVHNGDVIIKNAAQVGDTLKVINPDGSISYPYISILANGGDCGFGMDYTSNFGKGDEYHQALNLVSFGSVSLCFGNDISKSLSINQLVKRGYEIYNLDGSLIASPNTKGVGRIKGITNENLTSAFRKTLKSGKLDGLYLPRIPNVNGKPQFTIMTTNTAENYFPTLTSMVGKPNIPAHVVFTEFTMTFKQLYDGVATDSDPVLIPLYLMLVEYDMVRYPNGKLKNCPFDYLICGVDMSSIQYNLNNSVDAFICDYGDAKDDWFYNHFLRQICQIMYEKGYYEYVLESIDAKKVK